MAANVSLADQILSYQPGQKRPRDDETRGRSNAKRHRGSSQYSTVFPSHCTDPPPPLPPIKDALLAAKVFIHSSRTSFIDQLQDSDASSYESLEWVGDAAIQLAATLLIDARFPRMRAGHKAQTREALVNNKALADCSVRYGFDAPGKIQLPEELRAQSSATWIKVLGDVFEAYVGALVKAEADEMVGFKVVREWLRELWEPKLKSVEASRPLVNTYNTKQELAKLLSNPRAGVRLEYVDFKQPDAHMEKGRVWWSRCVRLTGWGLQKKELGRGEGWDKKTAEEEAARDALERKRDVVDAAHAKKLAFEEKAKEEEEAKK